jgi:hypothetical protein
MMESKTRRKPQVESKFWISRLVGSIFVYNVVLSILALCLLATIWPGSGANQFANQSLPAETFRMFTFSATISGEAIVILIAMLMGALGALVYTSTALVGHVAHADGDAEPNKWKDSYTLWYLVHPLLGASVAVIFYMVLRGALVNLSVGTGGLNLYGVAAISGMVGLSSKEATEKLKELFKTLFEGTQSPHDSQQTTPHS